MNEEKNNLSTLDAHLGAMIKAQRLKNHLTISDVAELADVSRGMLSKIENGQVSCSLDSLQRIAKALGMKLSTLFSEFDIPQSKAQLVKKGEGMEVVRRGTKKGHTYHLLAYDQGPKKLFEPFLISMDDESEVFPTFQHEGTEFIHMLQGKIEYKHGDQVYTLESGDSLTFDGNIPHGPVKLIKIPIRFLSVTYYQQTMDK